MSDASGRGSIPRRGWAFAFVATAVLIAFIYYSLQSIRPHRVSEHLQKISPVPAFQLIDQDGKSVTLDDLKGKIWVANFIFTRCKGPCPLTTLRMSELSRALKKTRGEVQLISFTVDPEYDTQPVLHEFAKQIGANPDNWRFLTGSSQSIQDIVVKGLLQPLMKEPDGTPAHSSRIVLVDGRGWLRGYEEGTEPEAVQKLMVDIGELLRENKTK
jgi:protein SCO1/2